MVLDNSEKDTADICSAINMAEYDRALSLIDVFNTPDSVDVFSLDILKLRCFIAKHDVDNAKLAADAVISFDPTKLKSINFTCPPFIDALVNFVFLLNPKMGMTDATTYPYREYIAKYGSMDKVSNQTVFKVYDLTWKCLNDYMRRESTNEFFKPLMDSLSADAVNELRDGHSSLLDSIVSLLSAWSPTQDSVTQENVSQTLLRIKG